MKQNQPFTCSYIFRRSSELKESLKKVKKEIINLDIKASNNKALMEEIVSELINCNKTTLYLLQQKAFINEDIIARKIQDAWKKHKNKK